MQEATANTLIPCREESVDFDTTQNLFIEAENLEALKILQKAYAGQVKMIYIDPPYNRGDDSFIYPDKFSETREEYARRVGDTDDNGYLQKDGLFQGAFRKNAKDNGHYHSNWLNMMLPRLHLAKTLLADDGVIFISIDDHEQAQLKLLCDEVFGEENFVGNFIVTSAPAGTQSAINVSTQHSYCLCYAKNYINIKFLIKRTEEELSQRYSDKDEYGRFYSERLWKRGVGGRKEDSPTLHFPVYFNPNTEEILIDEEYKENDGFIKIVPYHTAGVLGRWTWSRESMISKRNNLIVKKVAGEWKLHKKVYENEEVGKLPFSIIGADIGRTEVGGLEVKELFDNKKYFDYPKPINFIKHFISFIQQDNSLILDFFSGSGTTAHAVMQLNAEDGGNRRYICVQLPEETDENSEAAKAGFATIAEIAKERIRRAGAKIKAENPDKTIDTGFKVFKLNESHFKQWQGSLKNIRHSAPERSDGEESQSFSGKDSSPVAQNDGIGTAQNDGIGTVQNDGKAVGWASLPTATPTGVDNDHNQTVGLVGKDAHPTSLAMTDSFSGSPTQADLLSALENHTDTLLSDNTENIFYELLLRFGLRPTAEIIQDNGVYCVKDKGACFVFVIQAENADEAFFENILQKYQPMKIVVVEKVFNGKDDLKKNTALQIKDAGVMFVCV